MHLSDFIVPAGVFILVVVNLWYSGKDWYKKENGFMLFIGIVTMGFSWYQNWTNSEQTDTMSSNLETVLKNQKIDSTNNAEFQKYLKDSIGIQREGNKANVVSNTNLTKYYNQYNITQTLNTTEGAPDSLNYIVSRRNDSLFISPKNGTWSHGYVAFDTTNGDSFEADMSTGMGTAFPVDKISVNNNKTFNTHIFKMYDRAVYDKSPIILNMRSSPDRYIIFGDEGIPRKRYIYQNRKVKWIPE